MPESRSPHSREGVDLKEYFERILNEQDRRYDERFKAADLALVKAEQLLREYKASANEWRQTVVEQRGEFKTRLESAADLREMRALIDANSGRIAELKKFQDRNEGSDEMRSKLRSQQQWIVGLTVSVFLSIAGSIASILWRVFQGR